MILEDFHVHSTFSDGKHTPEEIAARALELGLTRLGFSDHGYAPYDTDCCMPRERIPAYQVCVDALRERYRGRLSIFCGIEQDLWSQTDTGGYDYVIGSVHYLREGGTFYAVDDTPEILRAAAKDCFDGDMDALGEAYYRSVGELRSRTGCDIVGHFDLVEKFSERDPELSCTGKRTEAAWREAAQRLLDEGCRWFEINTGAMSRGWRSIPYPAPDKLCFLRDHGARFLLSGDSHDANALCYAFGQVSARLKQIGITPERFVLPGRTVRKQ